MALTKINYNVNGTLVADEQISLSNGNKVVSLAHNNLMTSPAPIEIWTGTVKTGTQITDFTTAPNATKSWVYDITFGASVADGTYYATYYSQGDQIDADDFNDIHKSLENIFYDATQPPPPLMPAIPDGVTNNTPMIKAMLRWAKGRGGVTFYFPSGLYMLEDSLEIFANTRIILARYAEFRRNALYGNMIVNGIMSADNDPEYQDYSGYDGEGNIVIEGGTWNSMGATFNQSASGILLGHARYITIRDTRILDINANHAIEVNACQHVQILNCVIDGYEVDPDKEAIQIDIMASSGSFPHFGLYDNTACDNVLVEGCTILNYGRGVGSHTSATNVWYTNIKVVNNHFYNLQNHAVRGENWKGVTISGNTMDTVGIGIEMYTFNSTASGTYVISDNVMKNVTRTDSNGHAIWINGNNTTSEYHYDVTVSNNSISTCGYAGIQFEYVYDSACNNNIVSGCTQNGINVYNNSTNLSVSSNISRNNTGQGISISASNFCTFSFNKVYNNGNHGIVLSSSSDNDISSNFVHSNNTSGSTNHNIRLSTSATNNNVQGNVCRVGSNTNKPGYGISLASTATGNFVCNNDLLNGGATGALDDASAVANTTPGNRLA